MTIECSSAPSAGVVATKRPNRREAFLMRVAVWERDGQTKGCHWCGKPFVKWDNLLRSTLDHVVRLSDGGKHELDNCVLAHNLCNSSRHGLSDGIRENRVNTLLDKPGIP
jgi:5-methylcytosine-specific restriction endonuclease McrA